jgi:hypothetical protein
MDLGKNLPFAPRTHIPLPVEWSEAGCLVAPRQPT